MSRYTSTHKKNGNHVAYGFDHMCGYFYQEFDKDSMDCLIDLDSTFSNLSGAKLAVRLQDTDAPEYYIDKAFLDLPF